MSKIANYHTIKFVKITDHSAKRSHHRFFNYHIWLEQFPGF